MKIIKTLIPDVFIIEPTIFGDNRGYFYESFNDKLFSEAIGRKINFVQDNHSMSQKNTLRGLHYQIPPYEQAKLVRCTAGSVFDVAVDIRQNSPTFGKWVSVILSADNKRQLWIPEGFAHGFMSLEDNTEFLYKTNNFYSKDNERGLLWSDMDLNIPWPEAKDYILSEKDKLHPLLKTLSM
ncbi:dTDP-4-dehydrorhamnose 3,5-epimerase [Morganella morganii subsp. morganii]|uniref:dTDP-4-dehydrorhamnose 3,5-epimerase n=1 Tax=Morganella morganii TaxID=582 RepID=UPI001BDA8722|nr:dTDP-4-dehydrorhamnose 3,5-epimerase [Morganella morganii]MBT0395903.1 dTDP-4-dehydrorhamnose 3,5-epimerase [Morganella morganii subsp. morganii]